MADRCRRQKGIRVKLYVKTLYILDCSRFARYLFQVTASANVRPIHHMQHICSYWLCPLLAYGDDTGKYVTIAWTSHPTLSFDVFVKQSGTKVSNVGAAR